MYGWRPGVDSVSRAWHEEPSDPLARSATNRGMAYLLLDLSRHPGDVGYTEANIITPIKYTTPSIATDFRMGIRPSGGVIKFPPESEAKK